jgi:uncharacterized protein (TIGR02452 family)
MKYKDKEKNLRLFNFSKSANVNSPSFEVYKNENPNVTVVNKDSLEACQGLDNPFVLIFASAKKPGGGVRNGANAQEEAVFRKSNLSKIIEKLEPMYLLDYYTTDIIYLKDCKYLIDENEKPLDNPITFSAGIIPAINMNVFNGTQDLFELLTYRKIVSILNCASRNGHKNIVLGAFGCGVFNNDPQVISELFAQVLPCYNFENVVFAVLGDNYNTFKEAF